MRASLGSVQNEVANDAWKITITGFRENILRPKGATFHRIKKKPSRLILRKRFPLLRFGDAFWSLSQSFFGRSASYARTRHSAASSCMFGFSGDQPSITG